MNDYIFNSAAQSGEHVKLGWPVKDAYRVSKIAVCAMTRIQQREFDQDLRKDLIVNCVHPGYVNTVQYIFTFFSGTYSIYKGP